MRLGLIPSEGKQRIAFTGKDPTCWIKLLSILNGLYYKHGTFSASHRDGRPFGTPLLKYTARIFRKLPVRSTFPEGVTPAELTGWIQLQL